MSKTNPTFPVDARPFSLRVRNNDGVVERIRDILYFRIATGYYADGQLPSARDLAREFDVSHTSVASVYRQMAHAGIAEVIHGKGVYLTNRAKKLSSNYPLEDMRMRLRQLILRGSLYGLSKQTLAGILMEGTGDLQQDGTPSAILSVCCVECNKHDAKNLQRDLSARLEDLPVEFSATTTDEFVGGRPVGSVDLFITTFYHLRELQEVLETRSLRDPSTVVPVHYAPSTANLYEITQLDPGGRPVLVSASHEHTALVLSKILETYHPDLDITSAFDLDVAQMDPREFGALIYTPAAQKQVVERCHGRLPLVQIEFHIPPDSLDSIKEQILRHIT